MCSIAARLGIKTVFRVTIAIVLSLRMRSLYVMVFATAWTVMVNFMLNSVKYASSPLSEESTTHLMNRTSIKIASCVVDANGHSQVKGLSAREWNYFVLIALIDEILPWQPLLPINQVY